MVTDIQQATNDESMNGIPQKRCTGPCGRTLPATGKFFYAYYRPARGKVEMEARCKKCHNLQKKKKYEDGVDEKQYITARELSRRLNKSYKAITADIQYGKLSAFKRGKALRSPWYIHEEEAQRYTERVNGHIPIMIVGTPDQCGSCGITTGNIFGDVDGTSGEKYGYLCMRCYKIVRDFGGDPKRLREALHYVEITRLSRATQ